MTANPQSDEAAQKAVAGYVYLFALMYYSMAREITHTFGSAGEALLRKAIRLFGAECGRQIYRQQRGSRQCLHLDSLCGAGNFPGHPDYDMKWETSDGGHTICRVTKCPFARAWQQCEEQHVARIYCEEMHQGICSVFHPPVQIELLHALAKGDDHCEFVLHTSKISVNPCGQPQMAVDSLKEGNADDPFSIMSDMTYLAYWYMAHETHKSFGKAGEQCIRRGVRNFGKTRGERLRQRHLAEGREINLKTLFTFGDLPKDPRFKRNLHSLTPTERLSDTLVCPYYEIWRVHGDVEVGRFYCEEVHHAIWMTYDPDIEVNLKKTLTKGNDFCEFRIYFKEKEERKS